MSTRAQPMRKRRKGTTDLTVQEVYEMARWLVENGHGDLPVYVMYETVFGHASYLAGVREQSHWGLPGLFVGES